jgi:hypothetical protein
VSYSRTAAVKSATPDDARRIVNGCELVEASARRCLDVRNRGGIADDSSTYRLICGGIEFHDGGIRLKVKTDVATTLVNEEFRGE